MILLLLLALHEISRQHESLGKSDAVRASRGSKLHLERLGKTICLHHENVNYALRRHRFSIKISFFTKKWKTFSLKHKQINCSFTSVSSTHLVQSSNIIIWWTRRWSGTLLIRLRSSLPVTTMYNCSFEMFFMLTAAHTNRIGHVDPKITFNKNSETQEIEKFCLWRYSLSRAVDNSIKRLFDHIMEQQIPPTIRLLIVAKWASVKFFEYNQFNKKKVQKCTRTIAVSVPDTIFPSIRSTINLLAAELCARFESKSKKELNCVQQNGRNYIAEFEIKSDNDRREKKK